MTALSNKARVGVLGASGYSGAEMMRLLAQHPGIEIRLVTADRHAGKPVAEVFPHLGDMALPTLVKIDDADWDAVDAVFCCLPHATTQEVVSALPERLKVVDLSADFRLRDTAVYARWYGHEHLAPALQREAVYGLTEFARDAISDARLVASPGCYPTAALLPLVPLLEDGAIETDDVIIDAKSGVSGAGRSVKESMLFGEVAEGIHAYSIASHRHGPEIEQELSAASGRPVAVSFTPHLVPMNRGILATVYVRLSSGVTADDARATLMRRFAEEPFVRVLPAGGVPHTRHVRGSNHGLIGVFEDRLPGRAILVTAIDNLVKGASGQAIQSMNLMLDMPETAGLGQQPMFP